MRPLPKIRVLSKTEDNRKRRKYELDPTGEELLLDKSASSDTSTLKSVMSLITISDVGDIHAEAKRVGSNAFKFQSRFSDIDVQEKVTINDTPKEVAKKMAKEIQKLVKHASSTANAYYSDFKCGENRGKKLHWTAEQVAKGKNDGKSLESCILQKGVIKLDVIVPLQGRFVEATTFFIVGNRDHLINMDDNFASHFADMLKEDIKELWYDKPFKALKRLFSLARYEKNLPLLEKLAPILSGNVSLLSQVASDLETMVRLIEVSPTSLPLASMHNELMGMKARLSTVFQDFGEEKFDKTIDVLVKTNSRKELHDVMSKLADHLKEVVKREADKWKRSQGWTGVPKEVGGRLKIFGR
jgi:hypothetical protein